MIYNSKHVEILGKDGLLRIPLAICEALDIEIGDVLNIEITEYNNILITKKK